MSIVVDALQTYEGKGRLSGQWCHMMSDTGNLAELHSFAAKLGLRRSWFQNRRNAPHYDLRPSKRELAVTLGACEVSCMELGRIINSQIPPFPLPEGTTAADAGWAEPVDEAVQPVSERERTDG